MLKKRFQSYPLTGKLNTKADPKALPMPNLLLLENARRDKEGRISKKFGCQALGKSIVGQTELIEDPDALGVFNDELLAFHDQSMFGYSEQGDTYAYKGGCVSVAVKTTPVIKDNYNKYWADMAVINDISVFAYDRNPGVSITVVDNNTETELLSNWAINNSATRPRCVAFDGSLFVFYVDGNNLYALKIPPSNPLGHTITLISTAVNNANYSLDVIVHDTFMLVAYNVQGAAQIRLQKVNSSATVTATVNIAEAATDTVSLVRIASSQTCVLWHNATGVRCNFYNVNLVQTVAPATIEAIANVARITGYKLPDDTGIRVFYEVSAAATYNYYTKHVSITNAGTIGTPAVFLRSVGIASKAWAYSTETIEQGYICLTHESTEQSTFFVVKNDGTLVAKMQYANGGGILTRNMPASVTEKETGMFQFAILTKNPIISVSDRDFFTFKGVSSCTLDFSDVRNYTSEEVANSCLVAGGLIQSYDSSSITEHGFSLYPENVTLAQSSGAGTLTLLGTYSYSVCYEWTDNKGRIHRSAPSTPVQIVLTGANDTVTLTIPTLRLTNKRTIAGVFATIYRTDINIVVYRTVNLGTNYYQANPVATLTYNDVTADTVTYVDELPDTTLVARPPLYTTGEVLENIAPPSSSLMTVWRNRVWLVDEEDGLWYSKEISPDRPVEFSDSFIKRVEGFGGRITAIDSVKSSLVLFKNNSIFAVTGDGEDDTGANGSFTSPDNIAADVGCVDAKSVVSMPRGLMFKSAKGFYLLTEDFQTEYIGAAVEEWNDETITAAVLVGNQNVVRFTSENLTLSYNYIYDEWSVWTNTPALDAVVWKNIFVYIRKRANRSDVIVKEVNDFFLDIDQSYSLKVGLAFAQFAQLQGFQRVWRALLLGEYKSPHKLKISIGYDYQPFITDEYYWDAQASLGIDEYGDGAYYGTDGTFGGDEANNGNYQVRVHLTKQKSQAVRIVLEDLDSSGTYESFNLTSLGFEYGYKYGAAKLQPAQTL